MALSNLQVFSDFVYTVYTETLQQQVYLFNQASDNAIRLVAGDNVGDFNNEVMFAEIENLVKRRNAYGTADATTLNLGQKDIVSVKVGGYAGPVDMSAGQWDWIQMDPEAAALALAEQLAKASLRDKLNTGLGAAYAALVQNSAVTYDATGTSDSKASLRNLARASAKFGDSSDRIRAWVMHSVPAFDLLDKAIENSNSLFTFDSIRIYRDAVGRPIVVTDAPQLVTSVSTPAPKTTYHVLGLQGDGLRIEDNGDFRFNTDARNGKENIQETYQAQWSYNVRVRGYAWDTANGGKSPAAAALTTSTNWDKVATSDKEVAGVVLEVL